MTRPTAFLFMFTIVCALSLAACQPASSPAVESSPTVTASPASSPAPTETSTSSTSLRAPEAGEKVAQIQEKYTTPAGEETVTFAVFVDAKGVITDAETAIEAKAPTSVMRQKSFAAELPTVIKGKKLSELENVDRVGGSSLTTAAFNKALSSLKTQL
jgi:hypothetical protein